VNVLNVTEGYLQTGVWTEKLFQTNPFEFVTGITEQGYNPGSDGGQRIRVPELLTGFRGGSYADSPTQAVKRNIAGGKDDPTIGELAMGFAMPVLQSTLIGVGFKVAKKATASPRRMLNRQLRNFGLGDIIRV